MCGYGVQEIACTGGEKYTRSLLITRSLDWLPVFRSALRLWQKWRVCGGIVGQTWMGGISGMGTGMNGRKVKCRNLAGKEVALDSEICILY